MKTIKQKPFFAVTGNDLKSCQYQSSLDKDELLEKVAAGVVKSNLLWRDILSTCFQIVVAKSVNNSEHKLTCPSCKKVDGITLLTAPPGSNFPTYFCAACDIQNKNGNSIIELIQLFYSVPRREIIGIINGYTRRHAQMIKPVEKLKRQMDGVFHIEKP